MPENFVLFYFLLKTRLNESTFNLLIGFYKKNYECSFEEMSETSIGK